MKLDQEVKGRMNDIFAQVSDLPAKEQFQIMLLCAAHIAFLTDVKPEALGKEAENISLQWNRAVQLGIAKPKH